MELYEGLLTRRSIRKYNPEKKLTKDEILELIRAASYAPSAHNKQPWHFLVIQDAETLRTLRQIQPWTSFAKDAACAIVVCADEEECFHREKEGWNYAQIDGSLAAQVGIRAADGSCKPELDNAEWRRTVIMVKKPLEFIIPNIYIFALHFISSLYIMTDITQFNGSFANCPL